MAPESRAHPARLHAEDMVLWPWNFSLTHQRAGRGPPPPKEKEAEVSNFSEQGKAVAA